MESIMQEIFVVLAYAAGFALAGVAVYLVKVYLIPWLKTKIGAGNLETMLLWVRNFMAAAEVQFPGSGMGAEKAEWVIEQVYAQLEKLNIHIEKDVIRAAINGSMAALENAGIVNREKTDK